jgi:hypothetical protein
MILFSNAGGTAHVMRAAAQRNRDGDGAPLLVFHSRPGLLPHRAHSLMSELYPPSENDNVA